MDYIKLAFIILFLVFIYTVITGIFMKIANFIGELLGFGKLYRFIIERLSRNKDTD